MSSRDVLDLVWLVPALPIAGAIILLFFGKRIGEPKAGWIGSGLLACSFVWSVVTFFALRDVTPRAHVRNVFDWFVSGGLSVKVGFLVDPLSVTWILFVTGVATLIHVFAIGYMHGDRRFGRFFAYMNLFVASMLVLVLGSSFLVTFLGWEGVGLCSYLLVGFWFERNAAATASKKAFITTRVGDFGFMVAMFLIFAKLGSLDYSTTLPGAHTLADGTATAIALLLFLGAIGKSAQFPLHVWLPDAMEGPTPVSALIHAATMVTAGVFIVARAHPFFEASGAAGEWVAWIGGFTALAAATVALVQPDIKRVLAYSTISQIGYMILALGVKAYAAAVFMVVTHAFFKATLFLGAGSVIHGSGGVQDMRVMGRLRKYMPYTAGAFIVAWLAIAGVPPFSSFWSKDEILTKAFDAHNYGVWILGTVAAGLTGFYMAREVYLVFFGNERFRTVPVVAGGADDEAPPDADEPVGTPPPEFDTPTVSYGEPPRPVLLTGDPHESPPVMVGAILVLALLAAIGGVLDLPFRSLEALNKWLEPVFADVKPVHPPSFLGAAALSTLSVALGVAGILIAWALYKDGLRDASRDPADERLGRAGRIFGHAYYFDEGIAAAVSGPVRRAADWLAFVVDAKIIDGAVNGVATLIRKSSDQLRKVQSGLVREYALGIVIGVALLLVWIVTRAWG